MSTIHDAAPFAVTSADGTRIAFDRIGDGPPIIVVGGILCDRERTRPLATAFSRFATVLNVDRRGRGASGDTRPYAREREFDDLAALVAAAGGRAALYGHSSGAGLALRAVAQGLTVTRLILHEPPFGADDVESTTAAEGLARSVVAELDAGRGASAIEVFMSAAGVPPDTVASMSADPRLVAMAHTMRYDIEVMGELTSGGALPEDEVGAIGVPTLVLAGSASPDFFRDTASRIADRLRDGRLQILQGEGHEPTPALVASAVEAFLDGGTGSRAGNDRHQVRRSP